VQHLGRAGVGQMARHLFEDLKLSQRILHDYI
jgi:hypothetical protein